jgi:small-conductance mechanosensitive channel
MVLSYRSAGFTVEKLLVALLAVIVTVFLAVLVRNVMRRSLRPRLPQHVYRVIENIVFYSIIFTGALAIPGIFGVSLSALLVAGGFTGLVIGLASQQALSNLISGLFLLAEQPLRVGDPVNVGGVEGVVVDINVLSTRIRTWDGFVVRIPNSKVFEATISNYQRTRARRVEFRIGISYGSDISRAIDALTKLMDEHPFCLVNPPPQVFVDEYADSAIVLRVRCWAPPQVWFDTKIYLQTRAKEVLDKAGVEIPFPQLDLHIKDSTTIPLRFEGGEGGGKPSHGNKQL